MNFNPIKILFYFLTILYITSCQKENEYPKKYKLTNKNQEKVRCFEKGVELTDTAKINIKTKLFSQNYSRYYDAWDFEIELISESQARIITTDTTYELKIKRINNILYLEFPDTTYTSASNLNSFFKHMPLYVENNSKDGKFYRYLKCFYLTEQNNELHLPLILSAFIFFNDGNSVFTQSLPIVNNNINIEYILNSKSNVDFLEGEVVYNKE